VQEESLSSSDVVLLKAPAKGSLDLSRQREDGRVFFSPGRLGPGKQQSLQHQQPLPSQQQQQQRLKPVAGGCCENTLPKDQLVGDAEWKAQVCCQVSQLTSTS